MKRQQGLVMVFALLVLLSLTVLGVASVSSSLIQTKMATSAETASVAFDAAEATIAATILEAEDRAILAAPGVLDPLSQARQGTQINLAAQNLSCQQNGVWTDRTLTDTGLVSVGAGTFNSNPEVRSWSRTAFLTEKACLGSSNVIGGSNISCHVFLIRGCGQVEGNRYMVANTLAVSVFAPATN